MGGCLPSCSFSVNIESMEKCILAPENEVIIEKSYKSAHLKILIFPQQFEFGPNTL